MVYLRITRNGLVVWHRRGDDTARTRADFANLVKSIQQACNTKPLYVAVCLFFRQLGNLFGRS